MVDPRNAQHIAQPPELQEMEMEVEALDGATASLGFFVVVGLLIFACLQVGRFRCRRFLVSQLL